MSADEVSEYQRGDVVVDESGNHFVHTPHLAHKDDAGDWFGLPSNQASARGFYRTEDGSHPYSPVLVARLKP